LGALVLKAYQFSKIKPFRRVEIALDSGTMQKLIPAQPQPAILTGGYNEKNV
jgi:hypothetical protein